MTTELIISDIDGCITPEESAPWEIQGFFEFAAIVRDASKGASSLAPITLCTGRPQPYVEALMKLLDVRHPAICENGAVLYTLADNRARHAPGVTDEKISGLRRVRTLIETRILPDHPEATLQFGKEAQLSIFSEDPGLFSSAQEEIQRFVDREGGPELDMSPSHYYLNISLRGVDKGAAIRHILDQISLDKSQIAGIGDTIGDLAIRNAVGFFACPINSNDEIKAVADYVSPYPTVQGMLDILKRPEMQRM